MTIQFIQIGNMIFKSETITRIEHIDKSIKVFVGSFDTKVNFDTKEKAEEAFKQAIARLT